MLHEVPGTRSVGEHGRLQLACHIELMKTRKDDGLDLLLVVTLGDEVPAQDLEPAIARPHLLPEVRRAVAACGIHWIAGGPVVALIEGQERGSRTGQPGDHVDFAIAHGEVHHRTARKRQQRLGGLALGIRHAVKAILIDRVVDALCEVGLEFRRGHRNAVQEQHEVDAVLVVQRVVELTHHTQPVGGIARHDVGVERECGLELGECQLGLEANQFDAVSQHVERAALVELIAKSVEQRRAGVGAVVFGEDIPGVRLRGLYPRQHVGGE